MKILRQILYLTYFHMRARYRKTLAGFLWVIASPILTFLVQSLIFKGIFKFNIENYPLYLLAGLLPWFFLSQTFHSVTSCLVLSREVLLSFKINPIVIIASQVLDQFASFLAALLIMGLVFVLQGTGHFGFLRLLTILVDLTTILYFVFITTSILAFWHVFYRDVNFVVQFLMGLAFYVTPVFYTVGFFPEQYIWMLRFNFFIPVIKIFQISLYSWNDHLWTVNFIYTLIINLILTLVSFLSYKFKMRDFYINV
jgi:lipopolysaccharide transport system permease protein